MNQEDALAVAHRFTEFLETAGMADGLFTPEVFCDFTLPTWRLQAAALVNVMTVLCMPSRSARVFCGKVGCG